MKEIKLLSGEIAKVSDEDFEALNAYKWTRSRCSRLRQAPKYYARRRETIGGKRVTFYLHREVAKRMGELPPGMVVDHYPDTDGLNCQRENLRVVSHYQNMSASFFKPKESEPWL